MVDIPSPLRRPNDTGSNAPAPAKPNALQDDHGVALAPGAYGLAGFHMQRQRDIDIVRSARAAVTWTKRNESDGPQPSEAARVLHYRTSLAYLTGNMIRAEEGRWNTKARAVAR